jgi:hypothetical protein
VTMDALAIAIELEASYQIWRAQHERYLLLSRRLWLNDAAASEVREFRPHSGRAEVYGDRDHASDSLPMVKGEPVVADDIATHAVETISRAART